MGPGNQFVAEAKRMLFGRVGIDMIAGPTDSLILADKQADPFVPRTSSVRQSMDIFARLVGDRSSGFGRRSSRTVPKLIDDLPELNRNNASAAWRDYAEVILCENREDMAATSDEYAPEHLTVQADDLDWWLDRLSCYGSLFLGEETTVSYGDKASGTNHVLPTSGAASYTGGLSVHKYMKIVTWQRATREGSKPVAIATARISDWKVWKAMRVRRTCALPSIFHENFDLVGWQAMFELVPIVGYWILRHEALVYIGPEALDHRDVPDPTPQDGEVLVKVDSVGICGSDMHAFLGHDERRPAPDPWSRSGGPSQAVHAMAHASQSILS